MKENNGGDYIYLDDLQIYTIATSSWANGPSLPSKAKYATALVLDDNTLLVAGGETEYSAVATVAQYTVNTSTWGTFPSLPDPQSAGLWGLVSGAYTSSRLIFVGGWSTTYSDSVYQYDMELSAWDAFANMSTPRRYMGSATVGRPVGRL
jgi:N-acetylneuraminic acid mutarotase